MELPVLDPAVLLQPGVYETTLVGAGVLGLATTLVGWRFIRPWWEARGMRLEKEVADRQRMADSILYMLRADVKSGEMDLDDAITWFNRFASLLPLKELMKDADYKTLKELLLEKHEPKEEPKEEPRAQGALARMSARLKPATA